MKNFIFSLFIVALNALPVLAQDCVLTLRGYVKDEQGEVLPGATVLLPAFGKGTTTGVDGGFQFDGLCAGKYLIQVNYVGFEAVSVEIGIPIAEVPCINLHNVQILHDVVIEGEHLQHHSLSQAVSTLQQHDLEKLRGKPLGEMVKQLPGVSALASGPNIFKPVIQGLYGQRVLVLHNGVRLEGQQWGIEHAPEIDPFTASTIEVVKGAEAVRYGAEAMGGVIILSPASLRKMQRLGGETHLIGYTNGRGGVFSSLLEGKIKNNQHWGWRMQGSLKRTGDYRAAHYNLSNTGAIEGDASAAVAYYGDNKTVEFYLSTYNTTLGILRSAHTGNLEDLQEAIKSESPSYINDFTYVIENPRQKIHHHLVKAKATASITNGVNLFVQYGFQYNAREEFDIRRGGRSETPALALSLVTNTFDVYVDRNRNNKTGTLGISATFKNNANDPDLGIKPLLPQYDQYNGGFYLFEKWRLTNWLFEAGARYDFQHLLVYTFDADNNLIKPHYDFHYGAASLGTSYYINSVSRLINSISISARPPHVSELFSEGLHHSAGSIEEGILYNDGNWATDKTIKKESSYKWGITYQLEKEDLAFEISAYANRINNFVSLQPIETRLTIRGYFPVFKFKQTDALLTGSDVSLSWDVSDKITYMGKASYLYVSDVRNHDRLVYIPPPHMEHAITFHSDWVNMHETFATLRVSTHFKQTRAPRTLYPEDVANDNQNKNFDFMPPPPGYTLLQLEVGTTIPFTNRSLSMSIIAENLLNNTYRNYMNRLRYFADDTGANFSLRLSYKFHTHYNEN